MSYDRPEKPDFTGWTFNIEEVLGGDIGERIAQHVAETVFSAMKDDFHTIWLEDDGPHLWFFDQEKHDPFRFPLGNMQFEKTGERGAIAIAIRVFEGWLKELKAMQEKDA